MTAVSFESATLALICMGSVPHLCNFKDADLYDNAGLIIRHHHPVEAGKVRFHWCQRCHKENAELKRMSYTAARHGGYLLG